MKASFLIATGVGAAVLTLAGTASAQVANNQLPPPPSVAYAVASDMNGNLYARGLRQVMDQSRLEQTTQSREVARRQHGAERLALADQVQAQMDAGQCLAARQMAVEAGDLNMAIRVRQTCRN